MKVSLPVVSLRHQATSLLLTAVLLGACAAPTSTVTPPATVVPPAAVERAAIIGTATTLQLQPELAEAAEAWHLLSSQGDQIWPGWGASRIPLLIRDGEFDLLVGHPAPPQGFRLLPNTTFADQPVYRYAGHLVPVPAATAWEVGGVWSVAVPSRAEFQLAVDAQLGKGVVQLDPVNYTRAIVHEAFHAFAVTSVHGQIPNFGADVDEAKMIRRLSALPDQDKAYAVEGQTLVKALQTPDEQIAREGVAEFLKLRRARRAAEDQQIAAYERTTEWVEGLARYAEVALMRRASQTVYMPLDQAIQYPAAEEVWCQFLDQLGNPTINRDGFRGRYYVLGAGQAFLLDRLMPAWKGRVFNEKLSLEGLLQEAIQ